MSRFTLTLILTLLLLSGCQPVMAPSGSTDLQPEVGFKEFFPSDELPPPDYAEPGLAIQVESGGLTFFQ